MQSGLKSREMFFRAKKCIPCGVNSNFRYWGDDKTLVVKRGEGAYIWDLDDMRYIDYRLAFGPVILGHAHPEVINRIKESLSVGNAFAMTNEYEIRVAEKLCKMTGTDLVRFANSGTEATMGAIRIARAWSGRDAILKFEGAYHGFHDYSLWNTYPPIPGAGYRRSPILIPQGSGIPMGISQYIYSVPFNDKELLEKTVREHWGDIAAIIVEPLLGNQASIMPKDNFLGFVRELCDKYEIVMIMDEVKTGFRIAKGGAQEYFDVKADLVCYAKCLGNGFPVAAISGKREIMSEVAPGKIPHGGTYAANVIAMAAAEAVLDIINKGALEKVFTHGEKLMKGWKEILTDAGIPHIVQGPTAMPGIVFTEETECTEYRHWAEGDHELYEKIIQKLMEKGVMPDKDSREPWFISAAHTDSDADFALNALRDSVKEVLGK
jgi:glutamate-1-semialdehyde 2,1-aminomutase